VVNAVSTAGLRVQFLHEYSFTDVPMLFGLEKQNDGLWGPMGFPPATPADVLASGRTGRLT